jgi:hypothetical protein
MACYYLPKARASHPQKPRACVPVPHLCSATCLREDAWAKARWGVRNGSRELTPCVLIQRLR